MGRDKLSDEAQAYMEERLANFELDENASGFVVKCEYQNILA